MIININANGIVPALWFDKVDKNNERKRLKFFIMATYSFSC